MKDPLRTLDLRITLWNMKTSFYLAQGGRILIILLEGISERLLYLVFTFSFVG